MPDGLDFAILWNGVWREGRCYHSASGRMSVTYVDAQRFPLRAGMQARIPRYTLGPDRLLELANAYARELGYIPIRECTVVGEDTTITAGESTDVAVPVGNDDGPPVIVTISLSSNGDIRLLADTDIFLTTPPPDSGL